MSEESKLKVEMDGWMDEKIKNFYNIFAMQDKINVILKSIVANVKLYYMSPIVSTLIFSN
jgi:hypothetical protein